VTILDKMRDASRWRQLTIAEAAKVLDLLEKVGKVAAYSVGSDEYDQDYVEAFEEMQGAYHEVSHEKLRLEGLKETFTGRLPKGVTLEQARRALEPMGCTVDPVDRRSEL
jgi:hypothetical protein